MREAGAADVDTRIASPRESLRGHRDGARTPRPPASDRAASRRVRTGADLDPALQHRAERVHRRRRARRRAPCRTARPARPSAIEHRPHRRGEPEHRRALHLRGAHHLEVLDAVAARAEMPAPARVQRRVHPLPGREHLLDRAVPDRVHATWRPAVCPPGRTPPARRRRIRRPSPGASAYGAMSAAVRAPIEPSTGRSPPIAGSRGP